MTFLIDFATEFWNTTYDSKYKTTREKDKKKLHNENIIPRKEKKITKILLRSYSTSSMGANLKPKCEKRKNAPQIYNQEKIHALDAED